MPAPSSRQRPNPNDSGGPGRLVAATQVLNVTPDEFAWLQNLKSSCTNEDGSADREAFYHRLATGLGIMPLNRVERLTTAVRVRRDCLEIPCAGVPRVERLLPS